MNVESKVTHFTLQINIFDLAIQSYYSFQKQLFNQNLFLRVYAQLLHAKTNCDGYKEQGITYPAGHIQKLLLSEFYEECSIPPSVLEFVEAHGTGKKQNGQRSVAYTTIASQNWMLDFNANNSNLHIK